MDPTMRRPRSKQHSFSAKSNMSLYLRMSRTCTALTTRENLQSTHHARNAVAIGWSTRTDPTIEPRSSPLRSSGKQHVCGRSTRTDPTTREHRSTSCEYSSRRVRRILASRRGQHYSWIARGTHTQVLYPNTRFLYHKLHNSRIPIQAVP